MSLGFRAGVPDFWSMTAHNLYIAFTASQQNLSRLAYRTAIFTRMSHKHLPKNEDAIFVQKAKPKAVQSLEQQLRMARAITEAMGGKLH